MTKPELIINQPSTQMTMATPQAGQVLSGLNIQGHSNNVALVAKREYNKIVDANIKTANAEHKKATAAKAEAVKLYEDELKKLEIPAKFISDLKAVKTAVKVFYKNPTLQESLLRKKQDVASKPVDDDEADFGDDDDNEVGATAATAGRHIEVNPGTRTYTVTGSVMSDGRNVFTGSRQYPFPDGLTTLLTNIDAAGRKVAEAEARQKHCLEQKRNVDQVIEGAQADLALVTLRNDTVGKDVLAAFMASTLAVAEAADLTVDKDAVALALSAGSREEKKAIR